MADAATSAWDAVCKSFADAAAELLKAFGQAFAALPTLNLASAGISSTYGICLAIAATVAALLVFGGVIRTAWTHDGSGIAQAVTGVAKAVLAWMLTAAVATAALQASDEITRFVVDQSFGSQQALADRLGTIVNWAEVTGDPGQAILGGSLLLVFALIGIALVIVLWFELLLRNAAIAVLVATSPIAAAGPGERGHEGMVAARRVRDCPADHPQAGDRAGVRGRLRDGRHVETASSRCWRACSSWRWPCSAGR